MRILPVLDLMNGRVVRGLAGRRQEYQPICSRLTASPFPIAVARAFRTHFGLDELYLADLDAIGGKHPALPVYRDLLSAGFRLWVDAGSGAAGKHLEMLADAGITNLIAGLESLAGPDEMGVLLDRHSSSRLVFSLDMNNGIALAKETWKSTDPWIIARHVVQLGVVRILVLDLAGVGSRQGPPTADLCRRLRTEFPELEITTGGGIRGVKDLQHLRDQGVDFALVASALHDGQLTKNDLASFGGAPRSRSPEVSG